MLFVVLVSFYPIIIRHLFSEVSFGQAAAGGRAIYRGRVALIDSVFSTGAAIFGSEDYHDERETTDVVTSCGGYGQL